MSDTTKLLLGIVVAILVIALIIWLFASARRREVEARRMEAEALRAQLAERIPVVQERADRASVTARIAEEARREAEAAAEQAARLEREAHQHRAAADEVRSEQEQLAREADRLDPDVATDKEGYRVDESGRRATGSAVASALGMGALAQDDEEPDFADHENPFAGYATQPGSADSTVEDLPDDATGESAHSTDGEREDPDWVNGPVDEEAADELEAQAAADAQAADWINGPEDQPERDSESIAQEPPEGGAAESAHSPSGDSTEGEPRGQELTDAGAPFVVEAARPSGRRISRFEEIVDGGYGVGSAAAIDDGAQPLGHPVMGFRDTHTFVAPGAEGYGEAEPDVWFYDEDAARRSGFRAHGEQ